MAHVPAGASYTARARRARALGAVFRNHAAHVPSSGAPTRAMHMPAHTAAPSATLAFAQRARTRESVRAELLQGLQPT
eukprot:1139093-Alexandrium_andersonii.AAC.1